MTKKKSSKKKTENKKPQDSSVGTKNKKMPDHIDEYFKKTEGSKEVLQSRELFSADKDNIDLKTDINNDEISLIASLKFNDDFLQRKGLRPVFRNFFEPYMRLKVSKDRKSREEFVNMNKQNPQDDVLDKASNLSNLMNPRK